MAAIVAQKSIVAISPLMSFSSTSLPFLPLRYAFSCAAETNNPCLTSDLYIMPLNVGSFRSWRGRGLIYMTLIETLERREEALNVRQVAELLGVSDKKIYRLAAAGILPAFRVGKSVRFDAHDVADWLRKTKPSDELNPKKPRTQGIPPSGQDTRESGRKDHIWRSKVHSLEVALALKGSSE